MGNSPRYVGFLDPPYNVTLTDDSGKALDLSQCVPGSFTLTMLNASTLQARTCVGTWTTGNVYAIAAQGGASYQWTIDDMSVAGSWWLYTTVKLPNEPSPREFDPELIEIKAGTVGAGAAPPGVLPAPIAAALYFNVRDYGATPGSTAIVNTTAIMNTWTALKAAGGGVLYFPGPGSYTTSDLVFQSFSNFTLKGDRGVSIVPSPNTVASPGQATHDVCIIADCTDFSVEGLTFDGQRDTMAGDQFLTQNAASGQANITVQDGTKYVVGQGVSVSGGITANSGTEKNFTDWFLKINAISGNTLTLNSNLTHSYTGTGASGGAYLTQYQTGGVVAYTAAGRSLGNEDAQNGLHLLSCQRFSIRNCVAKNTWESQIKMGTGFQTTSTTDGCSNGIVTGNLCRHGFDQGISVWNSQYITVANNWCQDSGWGGVVFTHCNDCTGSANVCINNLYSPASDLNEGSGMAVEGGVRVVLQGNVCTGNNNNGIRLSNTPMFIGDSTITQLANAGANSIVVANNSAFKTGSSHTLIDLNNPLVRETIYINTVVGTTINLSRALRNSYTNGSKTTARYGEDNLITGNICSQNALSAGIKCDQQINLRVFSNDCSENGLLNGVFTDTQGTYGIQVENHCEGAVIQANTCRMNSQEGIFIDNLTRGTVVLGNDVSNAGIKGTNTKHGIKCLGLVDGALIANKVTNCTGDGIAMESGTVGTANCKVADNICSYNNNSGIRLDNGGYGMAVTGNKIAYNGDAGMKILGYKDSLFAGNQCFNQNGQEGIRFDDSGANFCLDNKVLGNLLYDDQGSPTQSWGFRELNNSARSIIRDNRCYGNTNAAQISKAATSTPCNITSPSVPSSTVAYTNTTTYDCTVIITGGTVTVISVGGVATGLTNGTVRVPVNGTIAITYSVAPSWKWYAE